MDSSLLNQYKYDDYKTDWLQGSQFNGGRLFTNVKALLITRYVKFVRKKKFSTSDFDLDNKTFIVHLASLASFNIYLFCKTHIILLKSSKVPTVISSK